MRKTEPKPKVIPPKLGSTRIDEHGNKIGRHTEKIAPVVYPPLPRGTGGRPRPHGLFKNAARPIGRRKTSSHGLFVNPMPGQIRAFMAAARGNEPGRRGRGGKR